MGFTQLVYFILGMIKESSQNALERYFQKAGKDTWMSQQAFSLARQKIQWEAFRELFDCGVEAHYQEYQDEIRRWHGLRVFAIDGSTLSLPNDGPLRAYYGTSGGKTSPAARGSILYDMLNNVVADALIEPMATDERTLAFTHIHHLQTLASFEAGKELLLFDRGYPSFELLQGLMAGNIRYLMRVRAKFSVEIDALSRGDHQVWLEQGGERLLVRVLKFRLSSGEEETLLADIQDKKHGLRAFKALYYRRWPAEAKYDQLKNKLEIENFSGRLARCVNLNLTIQQDRAALALCVNPRR